MTKHQLFLVAAASCVALAACEDNPDQFYSRAPAGAADRWNDGKTAPVYDPNARNDFTDNFNATSKQELCSGPVKQKVWAKMVNTPITPLRNIAGLDLAGGEQWTGLDFRDAEKVLCQSKSISGDEDSLTASWGDADEVVVTYKLTTNTIDFFQLNQGFRGKLEFKSRPTDLNDPSKPNPFGQHTYSIGVGTPVIRDGQTWELNWKKACTPGVTDCWEKQATELFDALMYTFDRGLQSTQDSCIKAQTCLAKAFSTGDAVFGVRPLGIYLYVPTILAGQPAASTPSYLYGFYVKLMPFSASEMFLKLDEEGPTATARDLGDMVPKKTCVQKLGLSYGEFLDTCVHVQQDPKGNDYVRGKLLGGMSHDKEAFDFSIEGVNLDFLSSSIGEDKTVGDDWLPQAADKAYEFNMDIRASGKVLNEYASDGTTFTFGGTGAIYREYARRVQSDIHAKMREWLGTRTPGATGCDQGWKLDAGKCVYQGFEIGDPACLFGDGQDESTWKPAAGCTGFEQFVTPASHTEAPSANVAKVSIGPMAQAFGFKTALKAGDPIALFCADPSPNATGKASCECTTDTECWSNHCGAPNANDNNKRSCEPVTDYYLQRCGGDLLGYQGSLLDGSFKRVVDYLGNGNPLNVPPALRDRKYYFRHWAHALVKYLKAADKYPTDLGRPEFMPGGSACDVRGEHVSYGCEPEPDHLLFDQIGQTGDRDKFEYIDRRFVSATQEPLKIEYQILINSSNQQEWKFHRKLTRPERALYMALSKDRTLPPANSEDNVRITNIVGSPILQAWRGVPGNPQKDAHYCASTLINGQPDPDCAAIGSTPPRDSKRGGAYMLDDYGQPLLTNYRGAFTGTVFSLGTSHLKLLETLPNIKSARVALPFFPDPYKPGQQTSAAAVPAPIVLVDWRPETPAHGIRIPLNGQFDKFIPSASVSFGGSSLALDIDYSLGADGAIIVNAVQSDEYMGNLFLCQDPLTGDLLSVEQYESMEVIMSWINSHPGADDACDLLVRYSAFNNFPMMLAAKKAGVVLNVGQGSGVGRITSVELFDPSLL